MNNSFLELFVYKRNLKRKKLQAAFQLFINNDVSTFNQLYYSILESLEEQALTRKLSTTDLYNFYYIATLVSMNKIEGNYEKFVVDDVIKKLQTKYLDLFGIMVFDQIRKYISRGRVESGVTLEVLKSKEKDFSGLNELMNKTFRSDMKRRNDVWNLVTENLAKLSKASSIKDICFFIDRINNCIHNTNELLFSKFANAQELMNAFDIIHKAPSLSSYKGKVNKDIRNIEV